MDDGMDHAATWILAYPEAQGNKLECKTFSWLKYVHDEIRLGGQLPDPRDLFDDEQVSVDVELDDLEYGTEPSPYPDDDDFILLTGPGTITRVAKRAGTRINAVFYGAINRRFAIAKNDNDSNILATYVCHEIEHTIMGIAHREDQKDGNVQRISNAGINWMLHHIFLPVTHFERSIALENIIAIACHDWEGLYTLKKPGPFIHSLEYAARKYVDDTFGEDRRAAPRCQAFFKFIAMLCDDYLHHNFGLCMNYSPNPNTTMATNVVMESLCDGMTFATPFTFGLTLRATPEGWKTFCTRTRIELCYAFVLLNEKHHRLYPHVPKKGEPAIKHESFGFGQGLNCNLIKNVMSYIGDDQTWYIKHHPDNPQHRVNSEEALGRHRTGRIMVGLKRPRIHYR